MRSLVRNAIKPVLGAAMGLALSAAGSSAAPLPAAVSDVPIGNGALQTVVLSGGCFWGVQGVFEHLSLIHI